MNASRRSGHSAFPLAGLLRSGVVTLLLTGCRAVVPAYGGDPVEAKAHADALAAALEYRFTHVTRTPKFANARTRLGRYALAPSKLVGDTSLWTEARTTRTGPQRDLELAAGLASGSYGFVARPHVALPSRVGDERHLIRLTSLGGDDWEWSTDVDHAVGTMPPARMNDVFRALFASAERPSAAARADYRAAFPRTAAALGRMFAVDSIVTLPQSDGSTLVALHLLTSSARLRPGFPELAKYVDKYLEPARYRFRLTDRAGGEWFDASQSKQRLVLRFRAKGGALQPLAGAARAMPDSLTLTVDASAKFGLFTVGASHLVGDFVHVDTPSERAWAMRFRQEPKWDLPLIAERLLRSPLRRPFEGSGMSFRLYLRRGPAGQTLLGRSYAVAVRESAIMRFLGNLGFTAMNDYAGKVEEEENRFLSEAMAALRADIRGL